MKKSLLLTFALLAFGFGVANAEIEVNAVNINPTAGDTLMFALPVEVNVYQDIQN